MPPGGNGRASAPSGDGVRGRRAPRRRGELGGVLAGLVLALGAGALAQFDAGDPVVAAVADGGEASVEVAEVEVAVEELLGRLAVAPEGSRAGYRREHFRHWSDEDRDGCSTRQEVLLAERRAGQPSGCTVEAGRWFSRYDGRRFTDPRALDIDHMVALGEAWDSGAAAWDAERRERYANDLGYRDALVAVSAASNRSKADRDPAEWRPPRVAAWCWYATAWTSVKVRWGLSADEPEMAALRELFATCRRPPPVAVPPAPADPSATARGPAR